MSLEWMPVSDPNGLFWDKGKGKDQDKEEYKYKYKEEEKYKSDIFSGCVPWVDGREWPKWAFLGNFRQAENWSETAQTSPNFTPQIALFHQILSGWQF